MNDTTTWNETTSTDDTNNGSLKLAPDAQNSWRANVLDPPRVSGATLPPGLSHAVAAILDAPLPPLEHDEDRLRGAAAAGLTDDQVTAIESRRFDVEPLRATRRSVLKAAKAALDEKGMGDGPERDRLLGIRTETDRMEAGPLMNTWSASDLFRLANTPLFIETLLLCATTFAAFRNGLFYCSNSGWEDLQNGIVASCISGIFAIAPTIVFKWCLGGLGTRARRRVEKTLQVVSLPLVLGGLLLFGYTFGSLMEMPNPWEASRGSLPLWVLVLASMVLETLASIALFSGICKRLTRIGQPTFADGAEWMAAQKRLASSNFALAEHKALCSRIDDAMKTLADARETYIQDALVIFRNAKGEMEAGVSATTAAARRQLFQDLFRPKSHNQ